MSNIEALENCSDFYASPYLAEYYELCVASVLEPSDGAHYLDAFEKMHSLRQAESDPSSPFLVLDIGTGNGRVIQDLVAALASRQDSRLSITEFIGLDKSPHMLERAALQPISPLVAGISWALGSALDLESVPPFRGDSRKADLIIFSLGSIAHLYREGEPEQFLRQISKILRKGTGRAYISTHDQLSEGSQEDHPPLLEKSTSKSFPNIFYRETGGQNTVEGNISSMTTEFEVVRRDQDGLDRVVEKNHVRMDLRIWSRDDFCTTVTKCGLNIVEILKSEDETFYVLSSDL